MIFTFQEVLDEVDDLLNFSTDDGGGVKTTKSGPIRNTDDVMKDLDDLINSWKAEK